LLPNGSIKITEEFFKKVIELIVDFLKTSNNRKENVVDFHHPHELENLIDFGIHDEPQSLQKVLNDCKQVLDFSVKTGIFLFIIIQLDKIYLFFKFKINFDIYTHNMTELQDIRQSLAISFFVFLKGHPRFFNQLFAGVDIVALVGDWLSSVTNTSVYTFEVAPMYILMENCIFDKLREIIGWKEPCDGLFSPGNFISRHLFSCHINLLH
jgi:glutamate decarboxylase